MVKMSEPLKKLATRATETSGRNSKERRPSNSKKSSDSENLGSESLDHFDSAKFIMKPQNWLGKTSFAVLLLSSLTFILVVVSLNLKIRIATFFTIPLFGFFTASALVISFEYALEVTYPIPESASCSVLNATIFLFSIIATLIIESLLDAIGYIATFAVILVMFLLCTFTVFFISSNLRRRKANLAGTEQ